MYALCPTERSRVALAYTRPPVECRDPAALLLFYGDMWAFIIWLRVYLEVPICPVEDPEGGGWLAATSLFKGVV